MLAMLIEVSMSLLAVAKQNNKVCTTKLVIIFQITKSFAYIARICAVFMYLTE